MSRIVFFGIPAHGHTNPTLEVVRELVSRGHQVWYYSYEMLRAKIEDAGAVFVGCDEENAEQNLTPKDSARVGKDLAFSTKILVDTTLALDSKVCADMQRLKPDCIVADSMAIWGKAVAMKLGIPFVSSTTTFAFNRHSAAIMKRSLGETLRMILSMPRIGKDIQRLQQHGYPVKNVLELIGSDESAPTVVYTSPEFQPCADTFPEWYAFVGPSVRPAQSSIEKIREKLVYISMGTVNNDLMPLYRQCITALADAPYQVILSVGSLVDVQAFGKLPEHISVFAHVDQIAVLEKADVFVSHCGMNSVSESLYFGVPLVMLPQTSEQGGVAERVRQLGAGVKLKKTDAKSILCAIERMLKDTACQSSARRISQSFRNCPGAKGAADTIEQICSGAAR